MAFTPDVPFPKSAGDPVRSKDWNDLVTETKRLDTAKLERAGDAITGSLSIAGALALGKAAAVAGAKLDVAGGDLRINDNNLLLRGGTDANHGLGWFGAGKLFAGANVDGPVLYGFSGGALGTTNGGQKAALNWDLNGRVGFGVPAPGFQVDIGDRIRLRQGASGSAGMWMFQAAAAADRAFVGMVDDNRVGLWGHGGAGWAFMMNVANGDLQVAGEINSSRFKATTLMSARQGALPLSTVFTSSGGTLLVYSSGSAFRGSVGTMGIQMRIDGLVMAELRAFTNEPNSHKALPPSFVVVTSIGAGAHTLDLVLSVAGTVTDFNDYFNVMVLELPFR